MLRRVFARIQPHIVPETMMFFKRILPAGMILAFLIFLTDGNLIYRSSIKLYLLGLALCVGGLYIMRIMAYLIFKVVTGTNKVKQDLYISNSKKRR